MSTRCHFPRGSPGSRTAGPRAAYGRLCKDLLSYLSSGCTVLCSHARKSYCPIPSQRCRTHTTLMGVLLCDQSRAQVSKDNAMLPPQRRLAYKARGGRVLRPVFQGTTWSSPTCTALYSSRRGEKDARVNPTTSNNNVKVNSHQPAGVDPAPQSRPLPPALQGWHHCHHH